MTHSLIRIATSASPAALHEASLQFYMELAGVRPPTSLLFFHLPPKTSDFFRMLKESLPEFPECSGLRWPTRHDATGEASGCLHMLYAQDRLYHFTTRELWEAAIVTQLPLLYFPEGFTGAPAQLYPPNTDGISLHRPDEHSVREVFEIIAMPHRFDQMQMMGIRAAGPKVIPGFPKFYWETGDSQPPKTTTSVQGRGLL